MTLLKGRLNKYCARGILNKVFIDASPAAGGGITLSTSASYMDTYPWIFRQVFRQKYPKKLYALFVKSAWNNEH